MKYRFSQVWARVLGTLGILIVGVGVGLAGLVMAGDPAPLGLEAGFRGLVAASCLVAGVLVGGSLVAAGQVLDAFLDQGRVLRRIHRRLAAWERVRSEDAEIRAFRDRGRSGRAG